MSNTNRRAETNNEPDSCLDELNLFSVEDTVPQEGYFRYHLCRAGIWKSLMAVWTIVTFICSWLEVQNQSGSRVFGFVAE